MIKIFKATNELLDVTVEAVRDIGGTIKPITSSFKEAGFMLEDEVLQAGMQQREQHDLANEALYARIKKLPKARQLYILSRERQPALPA